ncbi:MAG: hypothetical protein JST79_04255 [Acidobacteria bacterium]|nr:hypothetical protein [Acidobacteriota bacterium]
MKRQALIDTLKAAGKETIAWQAEDGSTVLVLPYGGRILGLFAPGDEENFLWTHAALGSVATAKEFYGGEQWHNSGGDRTWLAPEVDFFFPEFPSLNRYFQQRELDPGRYEAKPGSLPLLVNRAALTLSRSQQKVELEISKAISPAVNPLRYDDQANSSGLKFAGYTLRTTLQVLTKLATPAPIGLWNLLQLPHGGDMLVTTLSRTQPKIYMGTITAEELIVGDHLVRYKMNAAGEHKLGIRDVGITGRVGYLYANGPERSLVVRNFRVNPSGEYVDVPWAETRNFGFAFQACNVNSQLGAFSELEYHIPAVTAADGPARAEDESQVWAFRGPEKAVLQVARRLLGPEV